MGKQFPEIEAQKELIKSVIHEEESSFLRTLSTGIGMLDGIIRRSREQGIGQVGGHDAFVLYDTYGFPIDLTELISRENGMTVDINGFETELLAQKERSRNAAVVDADDWIEVHPIVESEFVGYDHLSTEVRIARYRKITSKGKTHYQLVFDRTPFYGASGGQAGDSGYIESDGLRTEITDTLRENNLTVHIASELPSDPAARFVAAVDLERRRATEANHTATHLLHDALKRVLGEHVEQKGSLVTTDYLRFDFSHFQKVTSDQLNQVERYVNDVVRANFPLIERRNCSLEEARGEGAIMLFGEKYGDTVRTVRFGDSMELCGGTHVQATGSVGYFRIVSESAISAGVRRIEAVTGIKAEETVRELSGLVAGLVSLVGSPSVTTAVRKLLENNAELQKRVDEMVREKVTAFVDGCIEADLCRSGTENASETATSAIAVKSMEVGFSPEAIRTIAFALRARSRDFAVVLGTRSEGKVNLAVILGDNAVNKGITASEILKIAAREIEGGGGGQPFFAMAGGKNPEGLPKAMATAENMIIEKLK
jgi:alanyl-tRNA synthetase